jgi:hypothetical protein
MQLGCWVSQRRVFVGEVSTQKRVYFVGETRQRRVFVGETRQKRACFVGGRGQKRVFEGKVGYWAG